jgi:hypothetical protein
LNDALQVLWNFDGFNWKIPVFPHWFGILLTFWVWRLNFVIFSVLYVLLSRLELDQIQNYWK